ncbi:CUB domain-containing protein [Ditylenchus destructor]|uniref:CUB domain-containing protein n=1 Tax=Ditylenchus destructor TaxID=166010 RepID=A0AAD4MU21_9BILA|nr:CUB domain-containing protein [Ditylenchus destructor]
MLCFLLFVFLLFSSYTVEGQPVVPMLPDKTAVEEEKSRQCPDVSLENVTHGYIHSPNFPQNYPDNSDCKWVIMAPEGNTVRLVLYAMKIYEGCCDFLYIYSGHGREKKLIQRLNGKANMTTDAEQPLGISYQTHNTNVMTVHFISNMELNDMGFYARFDAVPDTYEVDKTPTSPCPDTHYTGSHGVIVSPRWPALYQNEALCEYHIDVDAGNLIQLYINYFVTESIFDYLTVHDGNSTKSKKVTSYNATQEQGLALRSSSSSLTLRFNSNPAICKQGFSITYWEVDDS